MLQALMVISKRQKIKKLNQNVKKKLVYFSGIMSDNVKDKNNKKSWVRLTQYLKL